MITQTPLPTLKSLKQSDLVLGHWHVCFCIIGESHQVQIWKDNNLQFAELLACVEVPLTDCTHHHSFASLNNHQYQTPNYLVQVNFDMRPHPLPRCEGRLHFAFPVCHGVVPVTEVRWWVNKTHLHWWTQHTYPEIGGTIYVYSQSSLAIE